jgi:hypothetical protein
MMIVSFNNLSSSPLLKFETPIALTFPPLTSVSIALYVSTKSVSSLLVFPSPSLGISSLPLANAAG